MMMIPTVNSAAVRNHFKIHDWSEPEKNPDARKDAAPDSIFQRAGASGLPAVFA